VDKYKIMPINCHKDPFDLAKAIKYKQPKASRYIELYKGTIGKCWVQSEKDNVRWEFVKNLYGRKWALRK